MREFIHIESRSRMRCPDVLAKNNDFAFSQIFNFNSHGTMTRDHDSVTLKMKNVPLKDRTVLQTCCH